MQPKEKIILIHGTWGSDRGKQPENFAWWHEKSDFRKNLRIKFTKQFNRNLDIENFRWSGKNSDISRQRAAALLLGKMKKYDASKTPYHLIGHSHGGNVIWEALKQSHRVNYKPEYLCSWATVGTPFLALRQKLGAFYWLSNVLLIAMLLPFLFLALSYLFLAFSNVYGLLTGSFPGLARLILELPSWIKYLTATLLYVSVVFIAFHKSNGIKERLRQPYHNAAIEARSYISGRLPASSKKRQRYKHKFICFCLALPSLLIIAKYSAIIFIEICFDRMVHIALLSGALAIANDLAHWMFPINPGLTIDWERVRQCDIAYIVAWAMGFGVFFQLMVILLKKSNKIIAGLEKETYDKYKKEYLCIWSENDEAIAGLKAIHTIKKKTIIPTAIYNANMYNQNAKILRIHKKINPEYRFELPLSTKYDPAGYVFIAVFYIYNRCFQPMLNKFALNLFKYKAFGTDNEYGIIEKVSHHPIFDIKNAQNCRPLDPGINQRLIRHANAYAPPSPDLIRKIIGEIMLEGNIAPSTAKEIETHGHPSKALVHCAYFANGSVIAMLAKHIASRSKHSAKKMA